MQIKLALWYWCNQECLHSNCKRSVFSFFLFWPLNRWVCLLCDNTMPPGAK
uniref:Uncharacterized protein n=1 Tax=Anguilla anguilla TaxID=7936 RepID=A0A0E9WRL3_ANGAN